MLSSALPLLVKVLGITNFDLLGNYGKIRWLGNYFPVFAVNILFGSALLLFNRITHRWRSLPSPEAVTLDPGTSSLNHRGILGVVIEALTIAYFLVSSLYSTPSF